MQGRWKQVRDQGRAVKTLLQAFQGQGESRAWDTRQRVWPGCQRPRSCWASTCHPSGGLRLKWAASRT